MFDKSAKGFKVMAFHICDLQKKNSTGRELFFPVSRLMSTERPLSNEFSFVLGFAAGSFNMFFLQQLQKSNSPKLLNKFGVFWTVPYLHSIEIGNNIYIAKRGRGIETKKSNSLPQKYKSL